MIISLWKDNLEGDWELAQSTGDLIGLEFARSESPVWPEELEPGSWVGVDFDGTWSSTDNPGHFVPPYPLGEATPLMTLRVRIMRKAGLRVKLFTARAASPEAVSKLQIWMEKAIGEVLEVTDRKDYQMIRFFDDRALQVVPNTGRMALQ